MTQLSATTLKLFQECPRCFWLHVNQKIERPRGPFPSLPSGIDRVLKAYFDTYRVAGTLPPLIRGKLQGKLSTTALTLGFNDPTANARLWGKLDDCVIFPDDRLAPLDHKTRASPPDGVGYSEKYYKFQMDVYTLLLERDGHRTTRTAYLVYYTPVESVLHDGFKFEVTVHKILTEPERAYAVFLSAAQLLAGPLPPAGEACEFCRWAELRSRAPAAAESAVSVPRAAAPAKGRIKDAAPAPIPDDLFA